MRATCIASLLVLVAACSSQTIDQQNPCADAPLNDEPSACPTPPPGYQAEVVPILQAKCLVCHNPELADGGANPKYVPPDNFSTWALQFEVRGTINSQIFTCAMPNQDAGAVPLTESERTILLDWLVCGMPDAG